MASYQDIESRLAVVEDKLDFLMRATPLRVAHRLAPGHSELRPALDVYRMVKGMGLELQEAPHQEVSSIVGANGEQLISSVEEKV